MSSSSFQNLHNLFKSVITIREIAEPLVSFDSNQPSAKAFAFMKAKEFDIIGVREEGKITGYALRDELRDAPKDKSVGACLINIEKAPIISDSASLLTALETLRVEFA